MNKGLKELTWEAKPVFKDSLCSRVFSPSNIALAKYWGKRDIELNLPTNGSISITLDRYGSFTTVEFHDAFTQDQFILNGKLETGPAGGVPPKIELVLDELRNQASVKLRARIQSMNNFPTGAGLASSASGLSALTLASAQALQVKLDRTQLSEIARKGSGSACRSLFGGFVEWKCGERSDGKDSVAEQLFPPQHWPLHAFFIIVNEKQKTQPSTGGMERTRKTSPFFQAWVQSAQEQLPIIRQAIADRDFQRLSKAAEINALRMHASAIAAEPSVLYWQPKTIELIHKVWQMRQNGLLVFFTIDAGPNVVIFCEQEHVEQVHQELAVVEGVQLLRAKIGEGARSYDPNEDF